MAPSAATGGRSGGRRARARRLRIGGEAREAQGDRARYVDRTLKSEFDLEAVHGKRLQIFGVSNAHLTPEERAGAWRGFVREVLPACAAGRIAPVIDKVFAFGDLPAAKAYVDSNAQLGKVVVRIS